MTQEKLFEIAARAAINYSTELELLEAARKLAATIPADHWLRTDIATAIVGMAKGYFRASFTGKGKVTDITARRVATFINYFMATLG